MFMRGLKLAWLRIAMAILRVCTLFYRDLDVQQCKRVDIRVVPTGGARTLAINDLYECTRAPPWDL